MLHIKLIACLLLIVPLALTAAEFVSENELQAARAWRNIGDQLVEQPVQLPRHHHPDHTDDHEEGDDHDLYEKVVHYRPIAKSEGHHIPLKLPLYAGIVIKSYAKQAPTNSALNRGGLRGFLEEATTLIPIKDLQQLIANSIANDQQVRALMDLQKSEPIRAKVANLLESLEFRVLNDYARSQLKLELKNVWNFVKHFVSQTMELQPATPAEFTGSAGIRGLLKNMRAILPSEQLHDLYQQRMESDAELNIAVQRIKSTPFRQLLRNLRLVPEYQQLREEFAKAGVTFAELLELINSALGWSGDEFGDNGAGLKI